QFFDPFEVVDDRDRRDVNRDLDDFAGFAARHRLFDFAFFFDKSRVAARVGDPAADELFATAAGPDRVIGDRRAGVFVDEFGGPRFLCRLLRGGAGPCDSARDFFSRGAAGGAAAAAAAGSNPQRQYSE